MNLLWVLPKWPLPAIDGAMRAHMALLEEWPREAGTLDIAVFCPPTALPSAEKVEELRRVTGAREVILLPSAESPRWRRLLRSFVERSPLPLTVRRFDSREAREALAQAAGPRAWPWTHLMIDGTHAAALWVNQINFCFPDGCAVALRAHNKETKFWSQLANQSRGPKRWLLQREGVFMNRFQAAIVEAAKWIFPVSEVDAEKLRTLYPSARARTHALPIGFRWPTERSALPQTSSSTPRVLFLGRLDWLPNAEGLRWLLEHVWPAVHRLRPELTLDVVGGFASASLQETLRQTAGVQFHGLVPAVAPYFEASSLSLIPILTGSGTRVKAIESFRHGRSVLTTTRGIEGVPLVPGRDLLVADTPEDWIRHLTSVTREELDELGRSAFTSGRCHFDRLALQAALRAALGECSSARSASP